MPRKATSKAKKKADVEAIEIDIAELPTPHEPDEPEMSAASSSGSAALGEPPAKAMTPIASHGEAEAIAEAADTFEQAYEDRLPLERHEPPAEDVDAPELKVAESGRARQKTKAPKPVPVGDTSPPKPVPTGDTAEEFTPEERPPVRLERLQKILSQAGIASRRHAEEMIAEGRVQVNGKVVTELGTKADAGRDHIRVDGKLIQGAERQRYFVLNKPRGYVTTVSDPEGRPTVMEFFKKMGERLYPVGRLDYQSEGLLLVTNDGDLANKLTKAATGVEKTYLVKVSGQPTAEELDQLREGVAIDRTQPGGDRVQTAPAAIREVRSGDNPWYEVVLTEGRNRELRKMFEEIGHRVEKIRRVGYGPLVLDVEPGQLRELDADELAKLRLAADGKWRKPKPRPNPKEDRREAGRRGSPREAKFGRPGRPEERGRARPDDRAGVRQDRRRPPQRTGEWKRPAAQGENLQRSRPKVSDRAQDSVRPPRGEWRPGGGKPDRQRQADRGGAVRRDRPREDAGRREAGSRPAESRPRFEDRSRFQDRARQDRARQDRPRANRARFDSREDRRKPGDRTTSRPPRPEATGSSERFAPSRPSTSRPGGATGRKDGELRGARTGTSRGGTPRSGGRNAGRPNRASGTGSGRPPFKKPSGRSGSARERSNPRGGPRKRRD
ncbi:MAG TPA: pseudouridine synthase [Terracidiphilus sp.]